MWLLMGNAGNKTNQISDPKSIRLQSNTHVYVYIIEQYRLKWVIWLKPCSKGHPLAVPFNNMD